MLQLFNFNTRKTNNYFYKTTDINGLITSRCDNNHATSDVFPHCTKNSDAHRSKQIDRENIVLNKLDLLNSTRLEIGPKRHQNTAKNGAAKNKGASHSVICLLRLMGGSVRMFESASSAKGLFPTDEDKEHGNRGAAANAAIIRA